MSLDEVVCFHREMSLGARKLGSWRHDRDFTHPRATNAGTGARLCVGQLAHLVYAGGSPRRLRLDGRHAQALPLRALQSQADKGALRQYLLKVTGLSRARVARRIAQFAGGGATPHPEEWTCVPYRD